MDDDRFDIRWIGRNRKAQCPPNPNYPEGMDVDGRMPGSLFSCKVTVPYPAPECGFWVVACRKCGLTIAATAAGRPDDPKSIRLSCDTQELAKLN